MVITEVVGRNLLKNYYSGNGYTTYHVVVLVHKNRHIEILVLHKSLTYLLIDYGNTAVVATGLSIIKVKRTILIQSVGGVLISLSMAMSP